MELHRAARDLCLATPAAAFRGVMGRSVNRNARIAAQIQRLACARHRAYSQLAALELNFRSADSGRAIPPQGGHGQVLARRQQPAYARGELRLSRLELFPGRHAQKLLRAQTVVVEEAGPSPENAFASGLFEGLPRRYDRLAEVLSLGQNGKWRRELVRHIAHSQPRRILDVATGTAGVAIALAHATHADVVGVDLSGPMLEVGRKRVYDAGLDQRIHLEEARAEHLPFPDASFDAVTFTYLLRYVANPAATLLELSRVLRPSGAMAGLDFFVPANPFWMLSWRLYTRLIMPSGGFVLGGSAWWRAGRFLGPNIEQFYRRWHLDRIFEAWREAGFVDVEARVMSLGGGLVMWGRKHHAP